MFRTGVVAIAGFAVALVFGEHASAGGFYVPEIGSRAAGLGAAVVADGAEPSSIFHNPAGLAEAGGVQVEAATGLFFPQITFFRRPVTDPNTGANLHFDGVDNTNAVIAAPYLGASYQLTDRVVAGLAIYAPFGASLSFPDDGSQRQVVTSIALRTIFVSPTAAVTLPGGFSLGVAGNLIFGDLVLEQRNAIPYITGDPEQYPDPDRGIEGTTRLDGRDPFSVGATIGLGWRTRDGRVRIGASVMTPVTLELEGDAHVENPGISPLVDADLNMLQPAGVRDDQVRMALPLPLIARLGVALRPAPRWRIEADVNWQRWSTFDRLDVDFVHEHELLPTPGAYLYDVRVENAWRDTWSARLGAEATPFARPLALRAGVFYDQSPIADRYFTLLTPDSDKLGITAGARWSRPVGRGRLDLDLAAMHLFFRERDVAPMDGDAGSSGTILNKPAPSFFHGVTRAGFDMLTLAVAWRQ
jgi:long-chain fatty acid transport protein